MKFIFEMYITSRLLLVRVHGKALRHVYGWADNNIECSVILVSQYKPDNVGTTCMVAEDGVRHRRSHRTGCTGPDPTNFWDSNMGPAQNFVAKY